MATPIDSAFILHGPISVARPVGATRAHLVAFGGSLILHAAVFGAFAFLHVQPPRLARNDAIDVTLVSEAVRGVAKAAVRRDAAPAAVSTARTAPALAADETVAAPAPETDAQATVEARYDAVSLDNPKPPYPLALQRRGVGGRTILRARVLADGRCDEVVLMRSSGNGALDVSALDTVRRWRFIPARRGREPVESWIEVPITFRSVETST